jgi:hypothetical protein
MGTIVERIRPLNEIADDEKSRVHLESDIARWHRRIELLNGATRLALASGVSTSMLHVAQSPAERSANTHGDAGTQSAGLTPTPRTLFWVRL